MPASLRIKLSYNVKPQTQKSSFFKAKATLKTSSKDKEIKDGPAFFTDAGCHSSYMGTLRRPGAYVN
jgi:hypothetical protein